jgi:hypothetical protein
MVNETRYAVTPKEGTLTVGTHACFICILCGLTCNISLEVVHMGTKSFIQKGNYVVIINFSILAF